METKTFEWHEAWKETPKTNDGISELLIANYVAGKDSKTGKNIYEYVLCVYNEAEQCFVAIGSNLLDVAENQICLDWKYVHQWAYIPHTKDVNELKCKINQIARYIDYYCWECSECPVVDKCRDLKTGNCKETIVKYLKGE